VRLFSKHSRLCSDALLPLLLIDTVMPYMPGATLTALFDKEDLRSQLLSESGLRCAHLTHVITRHSPIVDWVLATYIF
jgi:hypothetical protein